ncbi:PREDICTED: outer envelope pore protein 21B, chloroplastic-like isoform X2 [Brassica oleracea var. oleracea]|uniref:outer envelope pore protein 21B, chloroplastic-like isoform X2 n=1 Tax=Brassica oleracea var. oleracea TaxID=109376 RepID=UPI0006A6CF8A|nr:PREDICTED: outer envelope pore protein 21B, chloroplastic-like isoform X2 [Brassica oleracea var. oleracea]
METSLRYSKSLRIHAKEKLPFNSRTHLQLHGELDAGTGAPSYFCAMIRHLFPEALTGLGVGLYYDKRHKLRSHVRGKKEFPMGANKLVTFNVKGRCDFDQDFNQNGLSLW